MKALSTNLKKAVEVATRSESGYVPAIHDALTTLLGSVIADDDLIPINDSLVRQKRRRIVLRDVVNVAYVHCRSIYENDGASPYERIIKYCAQQNDQYDNLHIRVITEMLLLIEFITLIREADHKQHVCRSYALSDEAKTALRK